MLRRYSTCTGETLRSTEEERSSGSAEAPGSAGADSTGTGSAPTSAISRSQLRQ
jgi:hypothetical protein